MKDLAMLYGWAIPFATLLLIDKYIGIGKKKFIYHKLESTWLFVSDVKFPELHKGVSILALRLSESIFGNKLLSLRFLFVSLLISWFGVSFATASFHITHEQISPIPNTTLLFYPVYLVNIVFDFLTIIITTLVLRKMMSLSSPMAFLLILIDILATFVLLMLCYTCIQWVSINSPKMPFARALLPELEEVQKIEIETVNKSIYNHSFFDSTLQKARIPSFLNEPIVVFSIPILPRGYHLLFPFLSRNNDFGFEREVERRISVRYSVLDISRKDVEEEVFRWFKSDPLFNIIMKGTEVGNNYVTSGRVYPSFSYDQYKEQVAQPASDIRSLLQRNGITETSIENMYIADAVGCISFLWCLSNSVDNYFFDLASFGIILSRSTELSSVWVDWHGEEHPETNFTIFSPSVKIRSMVNPVINFWIVTIEHMHSNYSKLSSFLIPINGHSHPGSYLDAIIASTVILPTLLLMIMVV